MRLRGSSPRIGGTGAEGGDSPHEVQDTSPLRGSASGMTGGDGYVRIAGMPKVEPSPTNTSVTP
jgi:hypothetical protein